MECCYLYYCNIFSPEGPGVWPFALSGLLPASTPLHLHLRVRKVATAQEGIHDLILFVLLLDGLGGGLGMPQLRVRRQFRLR